jgi:hypothetical protein
MTKSTNCAIRTIHSRRPTTSTSWKLWQGVEKARRRAAPRRAAPGNVQSPHRSFTKGMSPRTLCQLQQRPQETWYGSS